MDLEHEVESILAPKISEITKEMTQQLVGLIGIFTALSFIVFGGISSLDSIFGAVRNIKRAAIGASCSYSCGCMGVLHDESAIWIHVFCDTHYDFEETRCRKSS